MSSEKPEAFKPFFGEQDGLVDCHLDLRIGGEKLVPSEITALVGIEPTRAWAKGDEFPANSYSAGNKRPWGLWHLTTQKNSSKSLERHGQELLALLEGKEATFRHLIERDDVYVDLAVWLNAGGEPTGYQMRSETLKKLTEYCESIASYIV